ncbi:hypothetical protein D3C71_1616630 [compost metagenome]
MADAADDCGDACHYLCTTAVYAGGAFPARGDYRDDGSLGEPASGSSDGRGYGQNHARAAFFPYSANGLVVRDHLAHAAVLLGTCGCRYDGIADDGYACG